MPKKRGTLAAVGGGLGVVIVGLTLVAVSAVRGFPECTASGSFGWLVMILAGAVIGASSLALLASDRYTEDEPGGVPRSTTCAACGSEISEGWRLCPHCGELLSCDTASATLGGSAGSTPG